MIVANSNRPLRIAALLALILGVADLGFLIFVVSMKLLLHNVQYGWASTNFFNAIMFAGLFLVLAVVCEYLAEMRGDVKHRPLYVVHYELQSNAMLAHQERLNVVADEGNPEAFSLSTAASAKRDELAG